MSGDIAEGLGGITEGALMGAAVEPAHGETGSEREGQGRCRNCGGQPLGSFCQDCGQKVNVHRTLSAIAHDLVHGVLHLDGKFWSTLPLLVFRPGKLTRRYIEGERAKFVSPMAMFLFSVFAMFAVFQMVGLTVPSDLGGVSPSQFGPALEGQIERVEKDLEELDEQLAETDLDPAERTELEIQRRALLDQQEGLSQVSEFALGEGEDQADEVTGSIPNATEDNDGFNANITGIEELDDGILKKWSDNPGLMLYKLQANGYKFSWLLIPLSIPFVWLLFVWKRRFRAYDHAIFVTYSLSFMSLLFITASLMAFVPGFGPLLAFLLMLVPPIHVYKQLRGTYEIGRFSAFWRLMMLSIFIWIVLILFLQALLVLGAF